MTDLGDKLAALDRDVSRREGARDQALAALERDREGLSDLRGERERVDGALKVLQAAGEALAARMKSSLEAAGTSALRFCFGNPDYAVEVKLVAAKRQMQAEIQLRDGDVVAPVLEGHGGGIANVLALVFRAAVVRSRADIPQVLVLDEPCHYLNTPAAVERVKPLLAELARQGLQLIVVSSKEDLSGVEGAREFRFSKTPSGTVVEAV
jgi:hypothetical protein